MKKYIGLFNKPQNLYICTHVLCFTALYNAVGFMEHALEALKHRLEALDTLHVRFHNTNLGLWNKGLKFRAKALKLCSPELMSDCQI
jgi:hypothetical protein